MNPSVRIIRQRACGAQVFFYACAAAFSLSLVATVQGQDDLRVIRSSSTGNVTAVTSATGGPISVGGATPRNGDDAGRFLSVHGHLFGITDPDNELLAEKADVDAIGVMHRTYQQIHEGLPVFSGVLKLHENAAGQVLIANGNFRSIPDKLNTTPTLLLDDAFRLAKALTRSNSPLLDHSELVIVDPGWYGDRSRGVHLAYHLILSDPVEPIRDAYFIDAHTGDMLDTWSLVETIRDRRIHDANSTSSLPGTLVRSEGQSAVASPADVNKAYDYYGDTYDYYFRAFGRDSIDGVGLPMIATVRYLAPNTCPNAFWDGTQMVFCSNTVTDDIVGHELTHGVTQYTANLMYQNQSGQINEAMSDIFGELIDLFNGNAAFVGTPGGTPWPTHPSGPGQDTGNNLRTNCSFSPSYGNGVRWLVGEDATSFGGAIRDMWAPNCFGHPDRANSPNATCVTFDNGGVHFGSGVVNHAFAIMTDGKTFNGQTVVGIGPIKSGAVMYRALTTYLTPASDFEDLYWAANQAAADLIGTQPNDPRTGMPSDAFTAFDAAQVDKALLAVEMNTPGFCGQSRNILDSTPPQPCSSPAIPIFAEDFENGLGMWTTEVTGTPGTSYNWVATTQPLPFGRTGKAAFCDNLNSNCSQNEAASRSLISPVIQLPQSMHFPILAFHHYISSEQGFDGGRLRIRINNEPWDLVTIGSFFYNGYNDRLFNSSQGSNNPIGGSIAFTGTGGQWGTSLVYLGPILQSASTVQIRFDFSQDFCAGLDGWYVDDVQIYDCVGATDCNNNSIPDDFELAPGPRTDVFIKHPSGHEESYASDANDAGDGILVWAQRFQILVPKSIHTIKLHGIYYGAFDLPTDNFRVIIQRDSAFGGPGATVASQLNVPSTRTPTGHQLYGQYTEYQYDLDLNTAISLTPGTYWAQIYNNTAGSDTTFEWVLGEYTTGADYSAVSFSAPGSSWFSLPWNLSLELGGDVVGQDSDSDGSPDECDACPNDPDHVMVGICGCNQPDDPTDSDGDGVPDCVDNCPFVANADQKPGLLPGVGAACDQEVDCNNNDLPDTEDVLQARSPDCNGNTIPDECEIGILAAKSLPVIKINLGQTATLDGSSMFQGGVPPFTFDWTLRGQPGQERIVSDKPSFGPVAAGTYVARVVATDTIGCSATGYLTIQVDGGASAPDEGAGQQVISGQCGQTMCAASGGASIVAMLLCFTGLKVAMRRKQRR